VKRKGRAAKSPVADADPSYSLTDDSMGYLVRRTYRAFTRALEKRLKEHDVSLSMWFFLRLLWETDGKTQKELADELSLTQSSTVSAMDNLERRGLINRIRSVDDRRKINIYLTDAGRDLKRKLAHYALEVNQVALSDFDDAEVECLRSMLLKINRALANET
jgi:DNA-binding MarR family transcriptional regulator